MLNPKLVSFPRLRTSGNHASGFSCHESEFHPTILNASTSGVLSPTPSTDIRILSQLFLSAGPILRSCN
ncbi:uncharacterized protein BT62DRAFT_925949 [Guyanagaster necrorhizus]|uniref:Uncharacterized protein n=1 Tax=Guyanagaster necrorhizus TaxID=856835 RepID=A0A9P7W330_9AGAR|nr:uncharacterized protein BT62DRAFT_925949 [Guyanagaster necrorhizus MCA 3950]KAG7451768.1 hypothetical protein BT62DRAFT_925949 [Guyanagaster necrorhizus MCA 3950]